MADNECLLAQIGQNVPLPSSFSFSSDDHSPPRILIGLSHGDIWSTFQAAPVPRISNCTLDVFPVDILSLADAGRPVFAARVTLLMSKELDSWDEREISILGLRWVI